MTDPKDEGSHEDKRTSPATETQDANAELDPAENDDAVIGKAVRWSLVAVGVILVVVGVAAWLMSGEQERPAPIETVVAPPKPIVQSVELPDLHFTDITAESGIDFVHFSGARGDKLMPETMGGGCAFFDYDGDGDSDLLLVNGTYWPGDPDAANQPSPTSALYRNDGSGKFVDVTAGSGLDVAIYGMGAVIGDYDGDGDLDVYLTAVGTNRLLRNETIGSTPTFVDATADSGIAGSDQWSTGGAFFDYDRDGDLDLFVCNYIRWSRDIDLAIDYRLVGVGRAYGPPMNFQGAHCELFRNEGDGRFTDVSQEAGVRISNPATGEPVAKALSVVPVDFDGDGNLDLIVANDTTQNFLLRNRGDGSFEDIGQRAGVAYDRTGAATGAMGVDAAQFRNDGELGIFIGNFANEMTSVYVSQGMRDKFADEAIGEGIGARSRSMLTFGLLLLDVDLDGRLDMLQANGHLEQDINLVQSSQHYRQPAQLFWNAGPQSRSTFIPVPDEKVGDLSRPIVGRGLTFADIDLDGDLDVLLTQVGAAPLLLRNDLSAGRHWLRLRVTDSTSPGNRHAVGASVTLTAGGTQQVRTVNTSRSYLSQVELPITFGLGSVEHVDKLDVRWPDGTTETVAVDGINKEIVIVRQKNATR